MTDDRNISVANVQTLVTGDGVAAFFAALGYRTDSRQPQSVSAMGSPPGRSRARSSTSSASPCMTTARSSWTLIS